MCLFEELGILYYIHHVSKKKVADLLMTDQVTVCYIIADQHKWYNAWSNFCFQYRIKQEES